MERISDKVYSHRKIRRCRLRQRGSFVAPVSSERLREAQLRTVEDHLTDAVQAARLAGLSADEFAELARTLFEEEGL